MLVLEQSSCTSQFQCIMVFNTAGSASVLHCFGLKSRSLSVTNSRQLTGVLVIAASGHGGDDEDVFVLLWLRSIVLSHNRLSGTISSGLSTLTGLT